MDLINYGSVPRSQWVQQVPALEHLPMRPLVMNVSTGPEASADHPGRDAQYRNYERYATRGRFGECNLTDLSMGVIRLRLALGVLDDVSFRT